MTTVENKTMEKIGGFLFRLIVVMALAAGIMFIFNYPIERNAILPTLFAMVIAANIYVLLKLIDLYREDS